MGGGGDFPKLGSKSLQIKKASLIFDFSKSNVRDNVKVTITD
jgi:hypothetical protein